MGYIDQKKYYTNDGVNPTNNNWGSYQYTSLNEIVTNFLLMYQGNHQMINNVNRFQILFFAKRGIQELNYDALKEIKSLEAKALKADANDDNTAVGKSALELCTASGNTAMGAGSGDAVTTGTGLVALGYAALSTSDDGNYNTAVGYTAMGDGQAADDNTALGFEALKATTASDNTALGSRAMEYGTSQDHCVAIGRSAMQGDGTTAPTGNYNIAVGSFSLDATTTGHSNVAVGYGSGSAITSSSNVSSIGTTDMCMRGVPSVTCNTSPTSIGLFISNGKFT